MKGNTPKLIKKMIDDIEAAQADVRSGKPDLMLHGFAAMIAIVTDQAAMITEDYPEDRRMRQFVDGQIKELKKQHDVVAAIVDKEREAAAQRERWRTQAKLSEADRLARQKAIRAEERRTRQILREIAAQERSERLAKWAIEDAKQPPLFPLDDGSSTTASNLDAPGVKE